MGREIQVVPLGPPSPPNYLYQIQPSQSLPALRADCTLKSVLLSPRALTTFNAWLHRYALALTVNYGIFGFLAGSIALWPAPIGRWIAVVTTPLVLPSLVATFLSMRFDVIVELLQRYDFWYQSLTCASCPIIFAFYIRDLRGLCVISVVPMLLIVTLADANHRALRYFVAMSIFASFFTTADAIITSLSLIDDVQPLVLFRIYGRAVTAEAVMAHGFFIISIVHLHNAYVRRRFLSMIASEDPSKLTTTVQCVLIRSRLRWRPWPDEHSRQSMQARPTRRDFDPRFLQLRCRGVRSIIDAKQGLMGEQTTDRPISRLQRYELVFFSCAGIALSVSTVIVSALIPTNLHLRLVIGALSLACTARVSLWFLRNVYQRDMISILHTSFDFLFVFVQIVLAHLCVMDMCNWDGRALAAGSSFLLVHWALVIDAIPPIQRQRLGLNVRRLAFAIESIFLVTIVLIACDLMTWGSQRFLDNEIWHRHHHSGVANWSVGSFYLNRLATLIAWLGRSLWRLATFDSDELFLLRGAVEYDDYETYRRQHRSIESKTQLAQIVSALSQQSHHESNTPCPDDES